MRHEEPITRWILRTLVRAGAARAFVSASGELTADGAQLCAGLGIVFSKRSKASRAALSRALRDRLRDIERGARSSSLPSDNATLLGRLLGLRPAEIEVLAFTIALETDEALRECFAELRVRTHRGVCTKLARVLGLRTRQVERALAPNGRLRSVPVLHFVRADMPEQGPLALSHALQEVLVQPLASERDLLKQFLTPVSEVSLGIEDYPHLSADIDLLVRYLRAVLARGQRGVNVLLHGSPGTGKTALARALAHAVGAELHEVNLEDSDQDAHEGAARLNAYALSQRFLRSRKNTLLLLDEVEDIFPKHSHALLGYRSGSVLTKAWTNRLLERNAIPTFWVSNAIEQIDRAYVRRFDFVLEVGQPPRRVRRGVLDRHLSGLRLRADYLDELAEIAALSPAHVQRAASVVRLIAAAVGGDAESDVERLVHNNLRAFDPAALRARRRPSTFVYDTSLLNARIDVATLAAGLRRHGQGTLCFYGPAGTGKSELARHLAREAELPVLEKRASELLGKYVGETEQNIARMFDRAREEGALLLIDEADSFLAERAEARQSWEVTQVNEMLVQIEQFEGVLVCTTNLVEHFDRAALRRFALKVGFDYLTREQARALLSTTLATLGAEPAAGACLAELDRLRVLTPGDFAAIVRGARLLGRPCTAAEVVAMLAETCAHKRVRGARALGFGR